MSPYEESERCSKADMVNLKLGFKKSVAGRPLFAHDPYN